jgi:hypothetical protein
MGHPWDFTPGSLRLGNSGRWDVKRPYFVWLPVGLDLLAISLVRSRISP